LFARSPAAAPVERSAAQRPHRWVWKTRSHRL